MWHSCTPWGEDKAIIWVNWFSSPGQEVSVGVYNNPKFLLKDGHVCYDINHMQMDNQ